MKLLEIRIRLAESRFPIKGRLRDCSHYTLHPTKIQSPGNSSDSSDTEKSDVTPAAGNIGLSDTFSKRMIDREMRQRKPNQEEDDGDERPMNPHSQTMATSKRYLIVCLPTHCGNRHEIEEIELSKGFSDQDLIVALKAKYQNKRFVWRRLKDLRGFSGVRFARVSSFSIFNKNVLLTDLE